MRVCLDQVLQKIPLAFQEQPGGAGAPRTPITTAEDKPVTLKDIAAVHTKVKAEVGRYARVNRRWDELVREHEVLEAIIKKV